MTKRIRKVKFEDVAMVIACGIACACTILLAAFCWIEYLDTMEDVRDSVSIVDMQEIRSGIQHATFGIQNAVDALTKYNASNA